MEKFNNILSGSYKTETEKEANEIIEKYEILDKKDKNRKWEGIIKDMDLSFDNQRELNLAVARILRGKR